MAHRVSYKVIGIDVSKRTLEVFEYGTEQSFSIANDSASIEQWLAQWEVVVQFALEPTNRYHLLFAERVHERGHQVYLVAYSRPSLPLIPVQSCHPFQTKAAMHSTAKLPPQQGSR